MNADVWPRFVDAFVEVVKEGLRARERSLRYRGRFFIEGDSGQGAREELVATMDVYVRRSVRMTCWPGGTVTVEICSTRRSDHGRILLRIVEVLAPENAGRVVEAFEETLSIVMRAPNRFTERVARLWRGLGAPAA